MLKNCVILFLFFLGMSTSYAQYLEFGDIIKLLRLAEERVQVEKFLREKGFEYYDVEYIDDDDEGESTYYKLRYLKDIGSDICIISVWGDPDDEFYMVEESSENIKRWQDFLLILAEADLEPIDEWDDDNGLEGYKFETDDYYIKLEKVTDEDGITEYTFRISSL